MTLHPPTPHPSVTLNLLYSGICKDREMAAGLGGRVAGGFLLGVREDAFPFIATKSQCFFWLLDIHINGKNGGNISSSPPVTAPLHVSAAARPGARKEFG